MSKDSDAAIVPVPAAVLLRRKEVIGLGVVSAWGLRMALKEGRLRGSRLPGKTYQQYRKDLVLRALGMTPCDEHGRPMDGILATHAKVS